MLFGQQRSRAVLVCALAALAGTAFAQFSAVNSTHSVLAGTSGIAGPDLLFQQAASDPDLFINNFNVIGGTNWDAGLNPFFNGTYFDYNANTYGTYAFGTAISGEQSWYLGGFFERFIGIDVGNAVAAGIYDATIEILGGADSSANDVLYSFTQTIEVVDDWGLNLSSPDTAFTMAPGDTVTVNHVIQNNNSRTFYIGSRYFGWSMPGVDQFDFTFSNSYPTSVLGGQTVNPEHISITARPSFVNPFTFDHGIIGGFYQDDASFIQIGSTTLSPVPEPLSVSALALGTLALFRRNRNK